MRTHFILNEAPYGSERIYSGARLAGALVKQDGHELSQWTVWAAKVLVF